MSRWSDLIGTVESAFEIGSRAIAGLRRLRFRNSAGTIDLDATPTGANTITVPDFTGTAVVRSATGAINPASLAIPAIDTTDGGQLVLGYGGNTNPAIGGASQWRLVAVGSEFRLARSNSSNVAGTPLTIADSGAVTFAGASTFTAGLTSTTSLGLNVNPASGVALIRYSRADSGRWDVGITIDTESGSNTGTNFEIVRRTDANARIDAPLRIERATGITTIAGLIIGSGQVSSPQFNATGNTGLVINSDAAGSGADWSIAIARPASGMTASYTLTLPVDDGESGQVLSTNGSGVLSWATVGSGVASIGELTYTPSQSSVYDAPGTVCLGTFANLTDGSSTTGAGTQNTGFQWIKADAGSLKWVSAIGIASGSLGGGFGDVTTYISNRAIEVSDDDSRWLFIRSTGTLSSTSVVWLGIGQYCRYVRISVTSSWVGTTELRLLGA